MLTTIAPFWTLPNTVTVMAVRTQAKMVSSVGAEMDAYESQSKRLDVFMADPLFDLVEFGRLCGLYGLD